MRLLFAIGLCALAVFASGCGPVGTEFPWLLEVDQRFPRTEPFDQNGDGIDERLRHHGGSILYYTESGHVIQEYPLGDVALRPFGVDLTDDPGQEIVAPFIRRDTLFVAILGIRNDAMVPEVLRTIVVERRPAGQTLSEWDVRAISALPVPSFGQTNVLLFVNAGYSLWPRGVVLLDPVAATVLDRRYHGAAFMGTALVAGSNRDRFVIATGSPENGYELDGLRDDTSYLIDYTVEDDIIRRSPTNELGIGGDALLVSANDGLLLVHAFRPAAGSLQLGRVVIRDSRTSRISAAAEITLEGLTVVPRGETDVVVGLDRAGAAITFDRSLNETARRDLPEPPEIGTPNALIRVQEGNRHWLLFRGRSGHNYLLDERDLRVVARMESGGFGPRTFRMREGARWAVEQGESDRFMKRLRNDAYWVVMGLVPVSLFLLVGFAATIFWLRRRLLVSARVQAQNDLEKARIRAMLELTEIAKTIMRAAERTSDGGARSAEGDRIQRLLDSWGELVEIDRDSFEDQLYELVEANLHFASFGVPEMADALGLSQRQLQRRMQQRFSTSADSYLRRARIRRARHLLETTGASISSIARSVALGTPNSFSRAFKMSLGVTPSEYRSRLSHKPLGDKTPPNSGSGETE